ncbi:MAG TPA: hypothetical protein VGC41_05845, partial [Kofleriaceae bacterium]
MTLTERLIAEPFDDELRLVIADAMQQAGDPQGELAILQSRPIDTPELVTRQAELVQQVLGIGEPLDLADEKQILGVTWHLGWLRRARLQLVNFDEAPVSAHAHLERLLASPASRLLEQFELVVDTLWTRDVLVEEYLDRLIARGPYPAMRILAIGGFVTDGWPDRDISAVYVANRHSPDGDAAISQLVRMCPRLEELRVEGNVFELGPVELPQLRVLELRTSSLGKAALGGLERSRLPALERLVLWFGSCEYGHGDPCEASDVLRFVRTLRGPLRHLALANLPCADEVVDALVDAELPVLARLEHLDLSLGTLSRVDALIALRPQL